MGNLIDSNVTFWDVMIYILIYLIAMSLSRIYFKYRFDFYPGKDDPWAFESEPAEMIGAMGLFWPVTLPTTLVYGLIKKLFNLVSRLENWILKKIKK